MIITPVEVIDNIIMEFVRGDKEYYKWIFQTFCIDEMMDRRYIGFLPYSSININTVPSFFRYWNEIRRWD